MDEVLSKEIVKKDNEMGGNIPGGNFPGGNFPWGSLMGGNFSRGNSPGGIFLEPSNDTKSIKHKNLNVKSAEYYLSDTENLNYPVENNIRKFENYRSVQAIEPNISVNLDFHFSNTEVRDILKERTTLNNKKNDTFDNIPGKRSLIV